MECPICLDLLTNSTQITATQCCGNKFHEACLIKAFAHSNSCPLCRSVPDTVIIINSDTRCKNYFCIQVVIFGLVCIAILLYLVISSY